MRKRQIKFRGTDDWDRPVYKVLVESPYYIGSVSSLFSANSSVEEINNYFREHPKELLYFGDHFNCEPMGDKLADDIELEIIG